MKRLIACFVVIAVIATVVIAAPAIKTLVAQSEQHFEELGPRRRKRLFLGPDFANDFEARIAAGRLDCQHAAARSKRPGERRQQAAYLALGGEA